MVAGQALRNQWQRNFVLAPLRPANGPGCAQQQKTFLVNRVVAVKYRCAIWKSGGPHMAGFSAQSRDPSVGGSTENPESARSPSGKIPGRVPLITRAPAGQAAELHVVAGQSTRQYWRDLWSSRELLFFLAWRDVKVRYKQTLLGFGWILLRPLLMLMVLTLVFHRIAGLGKDQATPYALIVLAGLLPWQFFANAMTEASHSLVRNSQLVTKIYFPRLLIPIGSTLGGVIDFLLTLLLLAPLMVWYEHGPSWQIVFLPLFILHALAVALGAGIIFAAFNVRYRDVGFMVPFIVQFGLFLSPVGFRADLVPAGWQWLYQINPMVGVIEGFRWCLLGGADQEPPIQALVTSVIVTATLLLFALGYFRRVEKSFADVI